MKAYLDSSLIDSFFLPVVNGHQLYVETVGNPNGIPVVFLHGGPGGCITEKCRTFFNPEKYFVILFDQRGTGKSTPFLSLENNTPFSNAQDIEKIRKHLGIERWLVFGGSYGTTLGLVYAILFPERVQHLIFRGIFLGREEDISWLFQKGADGFYPEEFQKFKNIIPVEEQHNLVAAYYQRMIEGDNNQRARFCKAWSDWENSILRIKNEPLTEKIIPTDVSAGLLEAHYFKHQMFWDDDDFLLKNVHRLENIPMDIFHGRFDVDCRVQGAYELKKAYPTANLHIVQQASHYPYDRPLYDELIKKMDELANLYDIKP